MSKPAANPFFEIDFSKFADFSKLASEFKGPFNMEPLLAAQRRNIEAFTAVNQAAYEGIQSIARRQTDLVRQSIEEATNLMSTLLSSPGSPEEKVIRQAEASKAAVEKCIANARDVAETLNKCNSQAMDVVTNRLSEGLEELRGMMKAQKQNAA
jgi:phasin family protein